MVATPGITPCTEPALTVAVPAALLTHVPPVMVGSSVILSPTHTPDGPLSAGTGFTEIVFETAQMPNA